MNADNDNAAPPDTRAQPGTRAQGGAHAETHGAPADGTPTVFIVIGRVSKRRGGRKSEIHVMMQAPDDDHAVRETLNALSREGYAEAELDQIGILDGPPTDEPHASAYPGVLEGDVAIVTF